MRERDRRSPVMARGSCVGIGIYNKSIHSKRGDAKCERWVDAAEPSRASITHTWVVLLCEIFGLLQGDMYVLLRTAYVVLRR